MILNIYFPHIGVQCRNIFWKMQTFAFNFHTKALFCYTANGLSIAVKKD